MPVKSIYPIYREDSYVSFNSYKSFKKLAPKDLVFVQDSTEADLKIIIEAVDNGIARTLGLKRLMDPKLVAIAEGDRFNFPLLPGLYVSISKNYANPKRSHSHAYWSYLAETDGNPFCKGYVETEKKYLCCFTGKSNIPLRSRIFSTLKNESKYFLKDTMHTYRHFDGRRDVNEQEPYVRLIRESEFSICPRGKGASSIRLFESMRLGTAPIIIGDTWTAPLGPDWDSFSFRVKESEINTIPDLIETNRHRHKEMGLLARRAYENHFSKETIVPDSLKQLEAFSKHRSFERSLRVRRYLLHSLIYCLRQLNARLKKSFR